MAYSHGCCGTPARRSTRVVYGGSCPCFTVKVGEIIDVHIDVSDEAARGVTVVTAAPVASFVSSLDGNASTGSLVTSIVPPDRATIDIMVNAQDTNLQAGEVWSVSSQVTLSDGRTFVRTFKIKVQADCNTGACAPTASADNATPTTGVVISGSGATVPATLSAGVFYLTFPAGANFATVQFHTAGVYTLSGATPSDTNSIGVQVTAGTIITLQSGNEIASFRFTGTNDGADAVQAYAEYYTGNPNI